MPPMTEDLSVFLNPNEHATTATYLATSIDGIFENQFVEVNGVESAKPTFLCAEADVPGVAHGSSITIDAIVYSIVGHQPDGTGMILLILGV